MLIVISIMLTSSLVIFIPQLIYRIIKIIHLEINNSQEKFNYVMNDHYGFCDEYGNFKDYVEGTLKICIFVLISIFIIINTKIQAKKVENIEQYVTEVHYAYLYNLKDDVSITGDFILGRGSVNGGMYYFYVTKYKDGFVQNRIDVDDCYILENDKVKPEILKIEYKDKISSLKVSLFSLNAIEKQYKIIIPKGSITKDFIIDSE